MPAGSTIDSSRGITFEILVQGTISQRWVNWFGCLTILVQEEDGWRSLTTVELQVADQGALLGQLQKLHNLGFSLLQVRRTG